METKRTNQIIRKLGQDERYNLCPQCGREVYLYMDEDGDYWMGCTECGERSICYDHNFASGQNEVDFNRLSWNLWAPNGVYYPETLEKMSAKQGDYIVTNAIDGFIEFAGRLDEMYDFLEIQKNLNDQALYMIYTIINGRLINHGTSHLIDLTIRHYKEKM